MAHKIDEVKLTVRSNEFARDFVYQAACKFMSLHAIRPTRRIHALDILDKLMECIVLKSDPEHVWNVYIKLAVRSDRTLTLYLKNKGVGLDMATDFEILTTRLRQAETRILPADISIRGTAEKGVTVTATLANAQP